ncbi:MAG: outer membrane beta-barrel protein [Terriglobales bacterium]
MRFSNWILAFLACCGLAATASAQSNFSHLNFTVGGGEGIGRDEVAAFVGDSGQVTVGAGWNFTKMFGMDAEYMFYDLSFRPSVIEGQALLHPSGHMQSVSLDGIVNVPRHLGKASAYGIFGIGFYRRSVSETRQPLAPGTTCQPVWGRWWDIYCTAGNPPSIPPPPAAAQALSSLSKDAGGFNYGVGVTYPLNALNKAKVFLEFRYHRAYQSDGQTIVMPITVGLRW